MSQPIIEVRIPTYRRPVLLRRALESLLAQTDPDWVALVMDDSPDREAEAVVASLGDARIRYQANEKRLGGAGNIDQAFRPEALAGGSCACILEDDNFFLPEFLASNRALISTRPEDIIWHDQAVWIQEEVDARPAGRTTRGIWFEEGPVPVEDLHATLYLFEGISNGGLFWRLNKGVSLEVGPEVTDSGLQEYCRTWQIDRPVYFCARPLAVWSAMDNSLVTRSILNHRAFSSGAELVGRMVYRRYGKPSLERARRIAARRGWEQRLLDNAARIGVPSVAFTSPTGFLQWAKAFVRRFITPDPLAGYRF